MNRRLVAILSADIVGYSGLMETDQEGTVAALTTLRSEVLRPAVDQHGGTVVKSMGDGWLVEFNSTVDAVICAVRMQEQLAQHNLIRVRMGVHIGDVVHLDEDIFGDGVNVATRLEHLAAPGSVVISDAVYGALDETLRSGFADTGERRLKNISRPVRIWLWRQNGAEIAPLPDTPSDRPSIAVLAFSNLSADAAQDYVAEGISEEIMNALSRCRWLVVAARNSSFAYKRGATDVRSIARELGVRYVLDGTIRRAGDRIRITVQLIEGQSGARLWGERYDRNSDDIFALQDEIAETIAGTVEPELTAIEGAALRGQPVEDLSAWECYQLGLWHLYQFTRENLQTAQELLERAITLDHGLAPAYARLAYVQIQLGFYGAYDKRSQRLKDAASLAQEAIRLDDRDPTARVSLGRALAQAGEFDRAITELRSAVNLDPSFAQAHFALAQALCYADRPDEAMVHIEEAIRLSPHDPHLWTFLNVRALAQYMAGNLDAAAADEREALRLPNVTFWPAMLLVAILGRAGQNEEAAEAIDELYCFRPGMTCRDAIRELSFTDKPFGSESFIAKFHADLLAAGLPESVE